MWGETSVEPKKLKNSRGQSLIELMVAVAIGGIIALATGALFAFGIQQFSMLVDENQAQESLLESSFYIKDWLEQAAKLSCQNGAGNGGVNPLPTTTALAVDNSPPMTVPRGLLDCQDPNSGVGGGGRMLPSVGTALPGLAGHAWTQNKKNPLAIFVRETGGSFNDTLGVAAGPASSGGASIYEPSGIYFTPPSDGSVAGQLVGYSGVLWFAQQVAGNPNLNTGANFYFDHIVDVGVITGTVSSDAICYGTAPRNYGDSPPGTCPAPAAAALYNLQSLQIRIVARYVTLPMITTAISYLPTTAANANKGWVDLDMSIPINLKNNFLGINGTGLYSAERGYGGLYFFRMSAPPLSAFEF